MRDGDDIIGGEPSFCELPEDGCMGEPGFLGRHGRGEPIFDATYPLFMVHKSIMQVLFARVKKWRFGEISIATCEMIF